MNDEENKKKKSEFLTCPKCFTKHPISRNPIFCIECNYRFPRDKDGNLIPRNLAANLHEEETTELENNFITNQKSNTDSNTENKSKLEYPKLLINRPIPKGKYNFWTGVGIPLLSYVIMIIGTLVIMLLIGISVESALDLASDMTFTFLTSSLSLIFLIIPIFWIKRYHVEPLSFKERLSELGLPLNKYKGLNLLREILFGIFMGILGIFIVLGLQMLSFEIVDGITPGDFGDIINGGALSDFGFTVPTNLLDLILFVLMIFLFVGVPEEILFRGFVQKSFESKYSKKTALLLTAIYFSLFHIFIFILEPAIFLFLFIPYLGVSLLLGILRNFRGDLLAAVVMHIVYDITETIILFTILYA